MIKIARIVFNPIKSGFTLIELLVVIAVVGVLAGAVLVMINPGEQLARARDAQRRSVVKQLSQAMEVYYLDNGFHITNASGGTWQTILKNAGLIKTEYSLPASRVACALSMQGNICKYTFIPGMGGSSLEAIVESRSETVKAGGVCATDPVTNFAAIMWLSSSGKVGLRCMGATVNSWGEFDTLL